MSSGGAQRRWRATACVALTAVALTSPVHAQSSALSVFSRGKALRLLREKHSCLGCHALGGEGGILGPSLDDVRTRRDAAYIAGMIADPQRTRPGAMMPRIRMPDSERDLIIRVLGGDPSSIVARTAGTAGAIRGAPVDTSTTHGRVLYQAWCAGCHGATGAGDGPNAPSLPVRPARHSDARSMSARSDDALFDTIDGGGAIMDRSPRMPPFGGTLGARDIRALVAYIRSLCSCQGPAWSRAPHQ